MSHVFISLPIGGDGRDEVSINATEIASYRSHVVTSYSYVDYTEVVLKNGTIHDCRISKAKFEERLQLALRALADVDVPLDADRMSRPRLGSMFSGVGGGSWVA